MSRGHRNRRLPLSMLVGLLLALIASACGGAQEGPDAAAPETDTGAAETVQDAAEATTEATDAAGGTGDAEQTAAAEPADVDCTELFAGETAHLLGALQRRGRL